MNKHHPYNSIIEDKLHQLPVADADSLWNDMHAILDKKMPQEKERRRFIFWFFTRNGLLLLIILCLFISCSLFLLSKKDSLSTATKNSEPTLQTDQLVEKGSAKNFKEENENRLSTQKQIERTRKSVYAISSSNNAAGQVMSDFIEDRETNQSTELKTKNEFFQSAENVFKPEVNLKIADFNLRSIHQDFILTANKQEENNPLNQLIPLEKKSKNNNSENESGSYMGILSGIDLSSVHLKSARTGTTSGVIIGYNFNKNWGIESGILWDTKRVYDNGNNFTPPGYSPTNGIVITAVNGKSRLYEWPVNIKYNIIPGNHNFFATAGLSSYFMRVENYDYEYKQNNQPGGHNYISYKNETRNWFGVVNFSLGYTQKLGEIGSVRIEPYLKLPIKNLGVGNMPIMSTGLNIGFTRRLR